MARKRTTRNKKGEGNYHYDAKTKRHTHSIQFKGKRYHIADRDKATASLQFEELKRKLFGGVDLEGSQQLLKTYLWGYIDTEVAPRWKQSTAEDAHKRADLYILPTLGAIRLCDLKRRQIVAWVHGMVNEPDEKGTYWAFNSIKQALSLLRRALQVAVPELLEYNPAADVKVPTHRKGDEFKIDAEAAKEKAFTPEQMQQFLDEVWRTNPSHGRYAYYVLLGELGLRRGEGLGLRRKDIDFEQQTITIAQQVIRSPVTNAVSISTPKSDAGKRVIPGSDDLMTLMREQCLRVGAARPNDLLFPNARGERCQPNIVTQHFRRVCRRLGFTGFTLHSMRHYRVTRWRTEGVDLEVAAALAGHKGIKVTGEIYSAATMERKRAAVEKRKAE